MYIVDSGGSGDLDHDIGYTFFNLDYGTFLDIIFLDIPLMFFDCIRILYC